MFIQADNDTYINLHHVARVTKETSDDNKERYVLYGANNEILAFTEWDSVYIRDILEGVKQAGLIGEINSISVTDLSV